MIDLAAERQKRQDEERQDQEERQRWLDENPEVQHLKAEQRRWAIVIAETLHWGNEPEKHEEGEKALENLVRAEMRLDELGEDSKKLAAELEPELKEIRKQSFERWKMKYHY